MLLPAGCARCCELSCAACPKRHFIVSMTLYCFNEHSSRGNFDLQATTAAAAAAAVLTCCCVLLWLG